MLDLQDFRPILILKVLDCSFRILCFQQIYEFRRIGGDFGQTVGPLNIYLPDVRCPVVEMTYYL